VPFKLDVVKKILIVSCGRQMALYLASFSEWPVVHTCSKWLESCICCTLSVTSSRLPVTSLLPA